MKKEQFESAQKNIQKQIMQSVIQQIPTLDSIMQVDKMSPEDRVFYEVYKKYGNRNHTWQDFKAMFNSDITNMQATIKHWKTWDEINHNFSELHKQSDIVRTLMIKYNIKEFRKSDYKQYKNKFPDLIQAQENFNTLYRMAHVNYSTFDLEISKIEKQFEKEKATIAPENESKKLDLLARYIHKMSAITDLRNADFVVGERMEIYRDIILSNPQILNMALSFDSLTNTEKTKFATMILNASGREFGTSGNVVSGNENFYNPFNKTISLNPDRALDEFPLFEFLRLLAHEDSHRIDHQNPNMGMLGSQIMLWQDENYLERNKVSVNGYDIYRNQPTELASNYLDIPVAIGLDMTTDQIYLQKNQER